MASSSSPDSDDNVTLSGLKSNVDKSLKEKKWEEVQIKAFTAWLNSILAARGLEVHSLTEDLKDGLILVAVCELSSGKMIRGIDKRPMIPIQKINNINIALTFLRNDLHVRLDLIGAEDVFSGNLKMILGMIFAIFRKVVQGQISKFTGDGESESQEVGLLKWIREQTAGYDGVKIQDFKTSFNDGLAFNALVHRFDSNLFDYGAINKEDKEENLKRAFALAEKHLGVPQLLDVNEILSGEADERSIILYSSLYFHAFVSNEERLKAMGVQSTLTNQIEDTKTKLEQTTSELESTRQANAALQQDNSELLARIAALEEQLAFFKHARVSDLEAIDLLKDKVNVLSGLLEKEQSGRSDAEQARFRLQNEMTELCERLDRTEKLSESEIEELRKRLDLLKEQEERERRELELARQKLAETSTNFDSQKEEMERRKHELKEQISSLRKTVADEKAVRKQKEAEAQALRNECSKLKRAAIVQSHARSGLALLKRNLEEHLEDMYKWRELHHGQTEENRFNLGEVISATTNKSFEQTLTYLDEKLQEENKSLLRIVTLQDQTFQERIEKEGLLRMKFRKDWNKRFFRLTGSKLSWYPEDGNGRREGSVDLSKHCDIVRQKALKSDEPGIAKFWPLKLTVVLQVKQVVDGVESLVDQEKKLFIRAASKKERHTWFSLIAGKIASFHYRNVLDSAKEPRPDTRILTFLQSPEVTDLHLSGRPVGIEGIQAVSKVLPGHDQLKAISISDADLNDEKVAVFAEGVLKSQSIVSVDLSKNNLSDAAGTNLLAGLGALARISSLSLQGNKLGPGFAAALAGALDKFPLTHLDLSDNELGTSGVGSLASALSQVPVQFTTLNFAKNQVGDEACGPIAGLLSQNATIGIVDLSNNQITDAGVHALAQGLAANRTVHTLNLANNRISQAGLTHLRELLSQNKFIDSVDLAGNHLSAEQVAALNIPGFFYQSLSLTRSA